MQVAAAAGVAAGTGAAQLGLGYGLGVVVWPAVPGVDDSVWLGSLGWATWIAASSTVLGAVVAGRLRGAQGASWRSALAVAAGVGALLTVALVALPARLTVRPQTPSPEAVAAGYAAIGVLIGVVIAYWAVFSRPVAANLMVTVGYLWALAATAIVVELVTGRDSATYLTSWQFAESDGGTRYGTIYWPSAVLTLLAALLIGVVAVWPAVRRGHHGIGAATSGAVGPLLVAAAFLVLAPRLTGALGQLGSAYLIAPYAVLAGLAGSAFVVALGQRAAARRKQEHHRPAPPAATGVAAAGARPAVPEQARPAEQHRSTGDGEEPVTAELPQVTPERPRAAERRRAAPRGAAEPVTAEVPQVTREGRGPAGRDPGRPGEHIAAGATPAGAEPAAGRRRPASRAAAGTGNGPARSAGPDGRSTVAAPPASPPVAEINPPRDRAPGGRG
jgi:hypothetical protein